MGISSTLGVFSNILYIALAVAVLLLMVLIHEFGHYIAGRLLKFKITEFSVGFGKAIFSKTNKRGEKISLRIFPLGGFCAFKGEDDENADPNDPENFNNQKPWKRMIVYVAGAAFNIVSAVLFSFILLVSFGYDIPQITGIDDRYLYSSQFQEGDVIYEVNDEKIGVLQDNSLQSLLSKYSKGEDITLKVKRDGEFIELTVQLSHAFDNDNRLVYDQEGNPVYKLGITTKAYTFGFWEALGYCIPFTLGLVWMVLKSLWLLITFQIPITAIGGPITTISVIANQTAQNGMATFLFMLPLIAANLGVFNLLPFPALDGSHMVFTAIEWIRKKPLNRNVESYIHFAGLLLLFGFVIVVDILHFVL